MSARRIDDSAKLPATLTGLNLAISIAREATDAVPVVKQTLGAAVRILALAEKIDKDREALHALADRSFQLAQRVKDVMDGRAPDEKILASFERIIRAFDSIEVFMLKHTRRTRLLRAIGYVFTVPLHVERLSRELGDAVQELVLVALLDVNHEAHAVRKLVSENARYIGEFRLLRHCDVEKLEPIQFHRFRNDEGVRYYRARVHGQLAVVRHFDVTEFRNSRIVLHGGRYPNYETITAHDHIIKELSTVQRSHRNVARIYGWSRGSSLDRFTVFKSGYMPVESVLDNLPDPMTSMIRWACKLLDATDHLRRLGISWSPRHPPYALDEQLEPTIGLQNDLHRKRHNRDLLFEMGVHMVGIVQPFLYRLPRPEVEATDVQAAVVDCPNLLSRLVKVRKRCTISKANVTPGFALSNDTAERLLRVLAEAESPSFGEHHIRIWATILLALDKNRSHTLQDGLRVCYITHAARGSDSLDLHGLAEDSERIVYDWYHVELTVEQRDEIWDTLGIPAHSTEEFPGIYRLNGVHGSYRVSE